MGIIFIELTKANIMEIIATYTEKEIKNLIIKDLESRKLICLLDPEYIIELDDTVKTNYFTGVKVKVMPV